jgi:hypothetical protein
MDFFVKITKIWQKSRDFWFAENCGLKTRVVDGFTPWGSWNIVLGILSEVTFPLVLKSLKKWHTFNYQRPKKKYFTLSLKWSFMF